MDFLSHGSKVTPTFALELQDISKHFGTFAALSRVSFCVRPGSLHALLGENGAGKTTLMRIAFGMVRPDTGRILRDGIPGRIESPADAISAGIGMVHQHFMLASEMTVAENVELGGRGRYSARAAAEKVHRLCEETGLELDPSAKVSTLGIAARQRLEIIKALAHDAHILILDEPTAVLASAESRDLLAQIRKLVLTGTSVVLITHKLRDAQQYADDVSVLRHGNLILSGSMKDYSEDLLADAMLGQDRGGEAVPGNTVDSSTSIPVILLNGVGLIEQSGIRRLEDINIQVTAGEILGVAALEGSAAQLLRILAGRLKPTEGAAVLPSSVGFVPEERQRDALVPSFRLYENVALRDSGRKSGRMQWSQIRNNSISLLAKYDVRARDVDMAVQNLSGGNQQKLVLARELSGNPAALIAENPTRGLDIQSSATIHERLRQAKRNGCAVVVYSSDIDELVTLADRVIVVRDRRAVPAPLDADEIGARLLRSRMPE